MTERSHMAANDRDGSAVSIKGISFNSRCIGLLTLGGKCFLISYLQWTTTGGSSSALAAAEFLMKEMRGRACRGTPWSGQAV